MSVDEVEWAKLVEVIGLAERLEARFIAFSNESSPDGIPSGFSENAKIRVEDLEQHGDFPNRSENEKKKAAREVVAGYIAVTESRLSAAEQEQYAQFLAKEYFTKSDFNQLEEFYGSAWERLSEGGKAEMSHRVWEGVRRGEYSFMELPETVRKKEAEYLYQKLASGKELPANLKAIPEADRREFMVAVESGDQSRVDDVMSQEVFAKNVAVSAEVKQEVATQQAKRPEQKEVDKQKAGGTTEFKAAIDDSFDVGEISNNRQFSPPIIPSVGESSERTP